MTAWTTFFVLPFDITYDSYYLVKVISSCMFVYLVPFFWAIFRVVLRFDVKWTDTFASFFAVRIYMMMLTALIFPVACKFETGKPPYVVNDYRNKASDPIPQGRLCWNSGALLCPDGATEADCSYLGQDATWNSEVFACAFAVCGLCVSSILYRVWMKCPQPRGREEEGDPCCGCPIFSCAVQCSDCVECLPCFSIPKWWMGIEGGWFFPDPDKVEKPEMYYNGPYVLVEMFVQSACVTIGVFAGTLRDDQDTQKYGLMFGLMALNGIQAFVQMCIFNPSNIERVNLIMLGSKCLDTYSCLLGFIAVGAPDSTGLSICWFIGAIAWAAYLYLYVNKQDGIFDAMKANLEGKTEEQQAAIRKAMEDNAHIAFSKMLEPCGGESAANVIYAAHDTAEKVNTTVNAAQAAAKKAEEMTATDSNNTEREVKQTGGGVGVEIQPGAPPGGVYMKNGQWLDANGKPVD